MTTRLDVRLRVGRLRSYRIGSISGDESAAEISRALARCLRAAADEIDARLDAEQQPTPGEGDTRA